MLLGPIHHIIQKHSLTNSISQLNYLGGPTLQQFDKLVGNSPNRPNTPTSCVAAVPGDVSSELGAASGAGADDGLGAAATSSENCLHMEVSKHG